MWCAGELGNIVLRFHWRSPRVGSCTLEAEKTAAGFWLKQFETWVDYRERGWDPETKKNTEEMSNKVVKALITVGSNFCEWETKPTNRTFLESALACVCSYRWKPTGVCSMASVL